LLCPYDFRPFADFQDTDFLAFNETSELNRQKICPDFDGKRMEKITPKPRTPCLAGILT